MCVLDSSEPRNEYDCVQDYTTNKQVSALLQDLTLPYELIFKKTRNNTAVPESSSSSGSSTSSGGGGDYAGYGDLSERQKQQHYKESENKHLDLPENRKWKALVKLMNNH